MQLQISQAIKKKLQAQFTRWWYKQPKAPCFLRPLSAIVESKIKKREPLSIAAKAAGFVTDVPIIVVGNISVGGTGKSPLVLSLAQAFLIQGKKVGIISRGYGGMATDFPCQVTLESQSQEVGDEACQVAASLLSEYGSRCVVWVDPDRLRGVAALLAEHSDTDLILSDDGLQHYRLPRAMEIVVIDGLRGFGNGRCLPGGPLREPVSRLETVDAIVVNGGSRNHASDRLTLSPSSKDLNIVQEFFARTDTDAAEFKTPVLKMDLVPVGFFRVKDDAAVSIDNIQNHPLMAVAGIGNPKRFFDSLQHMGLTIDTISFPDHHAYSKEDFSEFSVDRLVLMTQKDAVKVKSFALENWLYLKVKVAFSLVDAENLYHVIQQSLAKWSLLPEKNSEADVKARNHFLKAVSTDVRSDEVSF